MSNTNYFKMDWWVYGYTQTCIRQFTHAFGWIIRSAAKYRDNILLKMEWNSICHPIMATVIDNIPKIKLSSQTIVNSSAKTEAQVIQAVRRNA